jgi:hypothetical protein
MQKSVRLLFDTAAPRKARLLKRREQFENGGLVKQEHIKHCLRWLDVGLKYEGFAIEGHRHTGSMRDAKGLNRSHSRPLQPEPLPSGVPEQRAIFASAPSTRSPPLDFNGLAGTFATGSTL